MRGANPSNLPSVGEKLDRARQRLQTAWADFVRYAALEEDGSPNPNHDVGKLSVAMAEYHQGAAAYQREFLNWRAASELYDRTVREYLEKRSNFFSQAIDYAKWLVIIASALLALSLELYRYFGEKLPLQSWQNVSYGAFVVCMSSTVLCTVLARYLFTRYEEIALRLSYTDVQLKGEQLEATTNHGTVSQLQNSLQELKEPEQRKVASLDWSSRLFRGANVLVAIGIILLVVFILSQFSRLSSSVSPQTPAVDFPSF